MVATRRKPHCQPSKTPANRPVRFFKIICECTIRSQKLRLPRKFARNYGEELSDKINLISPTGRIWKLGITKERQDIWIDSGWLQFMRHYSIHFKYVLMFKYKGTSNFKVHIFDRSTCAIDFSIIKKVKQEEEEEEEVEEEGGGNACAIKEEKEEQKRKLCAIIEKEGGQVFRSWQFSIRLKKMSAECQTAAAAASLMRPRNPSFVGILLPRYVRHKAMYVPSDFARRHICKSKKIVWIEAGDGQQWLASLSFIGGGANMGGQGWINFCHECQLKVGDVCIFELIARQKLTLKATIFHAA